MRLVGFLLLSLLVFGFVVGVKSENLSFSLDPLSYYYTSFTLDSTKRVRIVLKVISGPAVDLLLLDEYNFNLFRSQFVHGFYDVYVYLGYQDIRNVDKTIKLDAGRYFIVVVNWDLFDEANCSLSYEIKRENISGWLILGLIVVVIVVLIIVGASMGLKKE